MNTVFVYGTLKRGQCREAMWPVSPHTIRSAWVRGNLFGREDYPAMVAGPNKVLGEAWSFEPSQMARVLAALDEIEGTDGNGPSDLYHRVIVNAFGIDDLPIGNAFTYHYHRSVGNDGFREMPIEEGYQQWPSVNGTRQPD